MDFFSWLPIIIFIYAVTTIFGSNKKKPPNRRPDNTTRPQGPQGRDASYRRPETKSDRPGWREMFEELERELFPKEEPAKRPSPPATAQYPGTGQGYGGEGAGGLEGTAGMEGGGSGEGSWGSEGSWGREGALAGKIEKESPGQPGPKPQSISPKPIEQARPVFTALSENPLVQGVIWAEVLGKPRAYNNYAYPRRR